MTWDPKPLIATLATQVGQRIGEPDAVLVFDPSAVPKTGPKSVGVARQWCGRLGKTDNCQVGVFLGSVSRADHALVDFRLYLPEEWTGDRTRCRAAGVPKGATFRTRHELALEMPAEHGAKLPHRWISGDDEMGRPARFRRELREKNERYLLAVPSNTLVRDLDVGPPAYAGRGRPPERPFVRGDRWCAALPATAWTRIDVRDGTKGPREVEVVQRRVTAKLGRVTGPEECLVVTRELQGDGTYKHDDDLGFAPGETVALSEWARVAKAEHRIEKAQAHYPSSGRWGAAGRIGYHRCDGVARTGRVVPATPRRSHRRSRMSDTTRPVPPRAGRHPGRPRRAIRRRCGRTCRPTAGSN